MELDVLIPYNLLFHASFQKPTTPFKGSCLDLEENRFLLYNQQFLKISKKSNH